MNSCGDFYHFLIFTDQAHNVTIHNKEKSLRAGSQHEFVCEALGSRPPAIITWWFDDKQIQADEDKIQVVSTSFLFTKSNFYQNNTLTVQHPLTSENSCTICILWMHIVQMAIVTCWQSIKLLSLSPSLQCIDFFFKIVCPFRMLSALFSTAKKGIIIQSFPIYIVN